MNPSENVTYDRNYWKDFSGPDEDANSIVDGRYNITGCSSCYDANPLTDPFTQPENLWSQILEPVEFANVDNIIQVRWTPSINSRGLPQSYSLILATDPEDDSTWKIIATDLTSTEFRWNTSSNNSGDWYLLVVVQDIRGTSTNGIPIQVSIRKDDLLIFFESILENELIPFLVIILLFIIAGILGYYYIKKKNTLNTITDLFYSSSDNFLRDIYHKVIIGLENVKTELLGQDIQLPELTLPSEIAVIGNIFPPDLQQDLRSKIKGRTVFILIEIAYQHITKSYPSFLAKVLKIPQQTASDEITRLVSLGYIQHVVAKSTLLDTRFRYYSLTEKGYLFLHLLKESLTATLTKMHKEEIIE